MSLPDVTLTIQDGALGQVPASVANAQVKMGICSGGTPNTLYTLSDINTAQSSLGVGPLMEALADTLSVAGGPVYAVPLTPTTVGTVSSVDVSGATGVGTVTPLLAPASAILLKIVTGGALGTMTVAYSVGGGAYSAPLTSTVSSYVLRVPGTLTTVTFSSQTYTAADVWTVSTLGVITVAGSGTAGWVTQASSPLDVYDVRVHITTGGALGVGVFTYSIDGDNNLSGQILIPSGGKYAIPGTGVYLTFSSSTFIALDVYKFTTVAAAFTTSDVTSAFTYLLGQAVEWSWTHVHGMGASASAAASLAAVCATQMTAAETAFRYVFTVMECPTVEVDATITAAFVSFENRRVMVCAGDIGHVSVLTGLIRRRNNAVVVTSRLGAVSPSEHPGWVGSPEGSLPNVKSLYSNFSASSWTPDLLDASRFTTLRQHIGRAGYYVTRGNMMAASGSDFSSVMNRRVMDVACRVVRAGILPFLNSKFKVTDEDTIFEPDALKLEGRIKSQLRAVLQANGDAVIPDDAVVVDRGADILSTSTLPVSIRIIPNGYAEHITVTIGFSNPALGA